MKNIFFKKLKLAKIQDDFIYEILSDYSGTIESKINILEKSNSKDESLINFLKFLNNENRAEKYEKIKEDYLSLDEKFISKKYKYMHPFFYFCDSNRRKLMKLLELESIAPIKILDIGTGAGHFPTMASYFGHTCIGIDVKYDSRGGLKHLYDALTDFYGLDKFYGSVDPKTGDFKNYNLGKFDLITAFAIYFNKYKGVPWNPAIWRDFLKNLHDNFLNDGGKVALSLVRGKVTDDSWEFLSKYSEWNNKNSLYVIITKEKISKM